MTYEYTVLIYDTSIIKSMKRYCVCYECDYQYRYVVQRYINGMCFQAVSERMYYVMHICLVKYMMLYIWRMEFILS